MHILRQLLNLTYINLLKGKFKNVFGGMKTTLTKRMPDAVSGMFSELAVVGKEAWSQSVDMLYEKDPKKRQKIIKKPVLWIKQLILDS